MCQSLVCSVQLRRLVWVLTRDVHKTLSHKTETVNLQDRLETETFKTETTSLVLTSGLGLQDSGVKLGCHWTWSKSAEWWALTVVTGHVHCNNAGSWWWIDMRNASDSSSCSSSRINTTPHQLHGNKTTTCADKLNKIIMTMMMTMMLFLQWWKITTSDAPM